MARKRPGVLLRREGAGYGTTVTVHFQELLLGNNYHPPDQSSAPLVTVHHSSSCCQGKALYDRYYSTPLLRRLSPTVAKKITSKRTNFKSTETYCKSTTVPSFIMLLLFLMPHAGTRRTPPFHEITNFINQVVGKQLSGEW
jgi:hypothetical protein